jgi:hypothetical protein
MGDPGVMPRANRHYIPGHAWHITHRCHKKEFLLKFAKDRQSWIDWLFAAKKRYGMVVLNVRRTGQDRPWSKGSGQEDHFEREWP